MKYFNSNLFQFKSKSKSSFHRKDISILSDLLESEIDDEEIIQIIGFDIKDELQIRGFLPKSIYGQYMRIQRECDQRKALLVVLYTMKFHKKLQSVLVKSGSYPIILFIFSYIMLLFVNMILFPMFQSMLLFLGPKLELSGYQIILNILISVDTLLICCTTIGIIFAKIYPLKFYQIINSKIPRNFWAQLNSYLFCEKFMYFYGLGGSIDLVLKQIQWSSNKINYYLCDQVLDHLNQGFDLGSCLQIINPKLLAYFKMSEEGMDIHHYLKNHNQVQEILIINQIGKYSKVMLIYAYLKITTMIVIIYQVMLMPIRMMEQLL